MAAGRRYLDAALAQKLALAEFDGAPKSPVERLSEREFEVFVRLARGAIGAAHRAGSETLGLARSAPTCTTSNKSSAVDNQSELTLIAIRHGLIEA